MNVLRQEMRTGLLVVFAVILMVMTILYLGSPDVFVPQNTYYVYLDNASGLNVGADVALAGRKVGQITRLFSPVPEKERPDPKKETMLELKVNRSARIYKDVRVILSQNGMLGETFLDFTSGSEASGMAENHQKFLGIRLPGLDQAVPMVLEKLDPVLKQAVATFDSLQRTADNLTRLTAPGGTVEATLSEFKQVGTNLDVLSSSTGPIHKTFENLEQMTSPTGKFGLAMDDVRHVVGEGSDFAKTMKNAERFSRDLAENKDLSITLKNARQATSELTSTLTELRFKFGVIADNLEDATDTVKRQPWRLVWPSTKQYDENARERPAATPAARSKTRQR